MNQDYDVAAKIATDIWARIGEESSACFQSGLLFWEY